MHVCVCVSHSGHGSLENRFQELVLSFYCVDPGDSAHIARLGGKLLYPLNHLFHHDCHSFVLQNIVSEAVMYRDAYFISVSSTIPQALSDFGFPYLCILGT